jgi:sulfur relay (sulfurtransferase) DsrC/TusE family protein
VLLTQPVTHGLTDLHHLRYIRFLRGNIHEEYSITPDIRMITLMAKEETHLMLTMNHSGGLIINRMVTAKTKDPQNDAVTKSNK